MCPDAELLSAWMDGEVPRPWSDRLSAHIGSCASCSAKVESWRLVSAKLKAGEPLDEAALVARLGRRLDASLAERPSAEAGPRLAKPGTSLSPWRGLRLQPGLAAAAAFALLLLGGLSGGLLAGLLSSGNRVAPATIASGSPGMETLVRYLEAQNAPLNITIQLPSVGSGQITGDPMIIKTPPIETVALPALGGGFQGSAGRSPSEPGNPGP